MMSDPHVVPHAALTDVGRRRDHNEDAFLLDLPVLVVADGVGGSAKGEVASALAIEEFVAHAADVIAERGLDGAVRAMELAIAHANARVHGSQLVDESRRGMATTITAAVVRDGGELVVGHVGDSRLYVLSAAGARQVTEDHSVVAELVRSRRITPEEATTHPQRNVITRALGPERDVSVDAFSMHVGPGDWLLVCSDGLTEHVTDEELARIVLGSSRDATAAVRELVDLANERGGTDNITVVIAQPVPSDVSGELSVQAIDAASTEMQTTLLPEVDAPAEASGPLPILTPMDPRDEPTPRQRSKQTFWVMVAVIAVAVFALIVTAFVWSSSYFLVVRDDGMVGIDRGFPLAGLSTTYRHGTLAADDVSAADLDRYVAPHRLRDRTEALEVLEDLPAPVIDTTMPDDEAH